MGFLRDAGQGACQFQGATFGFHGGMDIHPQGGLHVGVAQDFGEGFDIHTVFDAACGEGVAQDVEIPDGDFQRPRKRRNLYCSVLGSIGLSLPVSR